MNLAALWRIVDLVAAGRSARLLVPDESRTAPVVRGTFTQVFWLLLTGFLIGVGAVAEAVLKTRAGEQLGTVVWSRVLVILAITVSVFYFLWRARSGYWWAYSRLRLFSVVFPVVAVVTSLVPGLYPGWLVEEQVGFALLLVVVAVLLSRRPVRAAYAKPTG